MDYKYIEDPLMIESKSFEIIHNEMKNNQLDLIRLNIMKRVIHTTADFIYEDILLFKENVEFTLLGLFKDGCTIITDTEMIRSGISKKLSSQLGIKIECFVGNEEVFKEAKEKGITRSMAGIDMAMKIPGKKVFAIGNAPTALYRILENYNKNKEGINGVIGVPVGFVGAAESKEALWEKDIPSIITRGRKGGSTIAVAIINSILREAVKDFE